MKTFLGGAFEFDDGNGVTAYCKGEPGIYVAGERRWGGVDHKFDWHASGARCIRCGVAYTDFESHARTIEGGASCDWVSAEGRARAEHERKGLVGTFLGGFIALTGGGFETGPRCPRCSGALTPEMSTKCPHCGGTLPQELWNREG